MKDNLDTRDTAPRPANRHPTQQVRVGEWEADIDVAIAPLIRLLWQAGIETTMSCQQDGFGYVWVEFPAADDLVDFLDAEGKHEPDPDSLYNRMNQVWRTSDPGRDWLFDVWPFDLALGWEGDGEVTEHHEGACAFCLASSVRFPPDDLPVVERRLRGHLRRLRSAGTQ
jgi:hypothetical protein